METLITIAILLLSDAIKKYKIQYLIEDKLFFIVKIICNSIFDCLF